MYVRVIQAALRESWLNDMKTVLSDQNFGRNTSQVEAALKKHEAISADIESRVSQCSLPTLSTLYTIFYRKIMFYTIFQMDILHLISYILCVCVWYCGGHHDRMVVLVMVSQAETIVLYNPSCCICIPCQINTSFPPSFLLSLMRYHFHIFRIMTTIACHRPNGHTLFSLVVSMTYQGALYLNLWKTYLKTVSTIFQSIRTCCHCYTIWNFAT